jgi:hypothetical protein
MKKVYHTFVRRHGLDAMQNLASLRHPPAALKITPSVSIADYTKQ